MNYIPKVDIPRFRKLMAIEILLNGLIAVKVNKVGEGEVEEKIPVGAAGTSLQPVADQRRASSLISSSTFASSNQTIKMASRPSNQFVMFKAVSLFHL